MRDADLPLFAWHPPCKLIAFPMVARIGKIRDVASKLVDKPTARSREHYQRQITDALIAQFGKLGLSEAEQDEQIAAFWSKVENEMNRLCYRGSTGNNDPRGAA